MFKEDNVPALKPVQPEPTSINAIPHEKEPDVTIKKDSFDSSSNKSSLEDAVVNNSAVDHQNVSNIDDSIVSHEGSISDASTATDTLGTNESGHQTDTLNQNIPHENSSSLSKASKVPRPWYKRRSMTRLASALSSSDISERNQRYEEACVHALAHFRHTVTEPSDLKYPTGKTAFYGRPMPAYPLPPREIEKIVDLKALRAQLRAKGPVQDKPHPMPDYVTDPKNHELPFNPLLHGHLLDKSGKVKMLDFLAVDFIVNKKQLDVAVDHAVQNLTSFNFTPEEMLRRLYQLKVMHGHAKSIVHHSSLNLRNPLVQKKIQLLKEAPPN